MTNYYMRSAESKDELLKELLHEYGIGIATLDEMEAYTKAVARGELKPAPDEPKVWFTSIEAFIGWVKNKYRQQSG